MESGKRVLVAGATGYLGGFVAKEFKARGCFVRALARDPQKLDSVEIHIDEAVQGEVTVPESLNGVCEGMDVVFSSVGITRQKGPLTFRDVDFQGNVNLLKAAKDAGVNKFVYVSVFRGPELEHLAIIKAHEDFVRELKGSGLEYAVVRPTGYFSDMGEYFSMAQQGRVFLFGSGKNQINPIHGADLAKVCVDATSKGNVEIDAGGPDILTWREIGELAFASLGTPVKILAIPAWVMKTGVFFLKLFNRHKGELLAFMLTMGTRDMVAPVIHGHRLKDHFAELAAKPGEQ